MVRQVTPPAVDWIILNLSQDERILVGANDYSPVSPRTWFDRLTMSGYEVPHHERI